MSETYIASRHGLIVFVTHDECTFNSSDREEDFHLFDFLIPLGRLDVLYY